MEKIIGIDLTQKNIRVAMLDHGRARLLLERKWNPDRSLAEQLLKIRTDVQQRFGITVIGASVALPVGVADDRRRKVLTACAEAGLHNGIGDGTGRLLSSLSAIALADYCSPEGRWEELRNVLVIRLGDVFEAAVAEAEDGFVSLKKCQCDSSLSAAKFYQRVAVALANSFWEQHHINVRSHSVIMARLQQAAQKAVGELKQKPQTVVQIPGLAQGCDLQVRITREHFLKLTQDLMEEMSKHILQLIHHTPIHRVVLTSDAANIYGIGDILRFDAEGAQYSAVDPSYAVAFGAAWQAGFRCGECNVFLETQYLQNISLQSQFPLMESCQVTPIIQIYKLEKNGQSQAGFTLVEKSADCTVQDRYIHYVISEIPKKTENDPGIDVVLTADCHGLWQIRAVDVASGKKLPVKQAAGETTAQLRPQLASGHKEVPSQKQEEEWIRKMLPVYDNLDRALKQPTSDAAYQKGVQLTMKELEKIFGEMGVEFFGQVGERFDPNVHNAVVHVYDGSRGENEISQVIERGVRHWGRILRFATVQVAN